MAEEWRSPLKPSDPGEVGRVYYLNIALVFRSGEEWTQAAEFTLNPEQGRTIEKMLTESTFIPKPFKANLLRKRIHEERLPTGQWFQMWISAKKAPHNWNPQLKRKVFFRKQELEKKGPLLFDAKGGILR